MPASAPLMATPVTVIAFAVPMFLVTNEPAIDAVLRFTVSFVSTPTSAADVVSSSAVALVVALYTRLLVAMPLTVSVFAVMLAVVVGCVSV